MHAVPRQPIVIDDDQAEKKIEFGKTGHDHQILSIGSLAYFQFLHCSSLRVLRRHTNNIVEFVNILPNSHIATTTSCILPQHTTNMSAASQPKGAALLAPSVYNFNKYDLMYFLKGAAAGGICCSVTHGALTPVDVVKTRVQLDPTKVCCTARNVGGCISLGYHSFDQYSTLDGNCRRIGPGI